MARRAPLLAVVLVSVPLSAWAQTTYHLHKEAGPISPYLLLKTDGPDFGSSAVITSTDMKNTTFTDFNITRFISTTGVTGSPGYIPSGSTIRFNVYMKKSSNFGVMYPLMKLYVKNSAETLLCSADGSTQPPPTSAISLTMSLFTVQCQTSSGVTVLASDRFFVEANVHLTTLAGNHSVTASIGLETSTDSTVQIPTLQPLPTITSLNPSAGLVGSTVTVNG